MATILIERKFIRKLHPVSDTFYNSKFW